MSDQLGGSAATGGTDVGQPDVAAAPDAPAAADTTGSTEQATEPTGSRAAMLGWGLGGLALGVALTFAAMRLGQRSRTAQNQPVTALWSSAEELQRR